MIHVELIQQVPQEAGKPILRPPAGGRTIVSLAAVRVISRRRPSSR